MPPLVQHPPSSCVKNNENFKSNGVTSVAFTRWPLTQFHLFCPRRRHTSEEMLYLVVSVVSYVCVRREISKLLSPRNHPTHSNNYTYNSS